VSSAILRCTSPSRSRTDRLEGGLNILHELLELLDVELLPTQFQSATRPESALTGPPESERCHDGIQPRRPSVNHVLRNCWRNLRRSLLPLHPRPCEDVLAERCST